MKTQNLLIGLAALLCAAGSSLASALSVPPHYINVRYCNEANWVCSTVNACTVSGNSVCAVDVQGFTAPVYDNKVNATTCSTLVLSWNTIVEVGKPKKVCAVR